MTPSGAPPGPRRAHAQRNRERLVAAAHQVFAEVGPDASLNEIARRADVGPGTLYRHFPTRTALLAAVLADRIETLCRRADELATTEPADAALVGWMGAFLAHARLNHGLGGALMLAEPDELGTDCHQRIRDTAAGLLTQAQQSGTARPDMSPDDLLQLAVGIALATTRSDDPAEPNRLLAIVLDAVLDKAATRSARPSDKAHQATRTPHNP